MLMLAATQRLAAQDRRPPTSRSIPFTPCKLLVAIGRATGDHEYQLFKGSVTHLHSTVIRATIRHGRRRRPRELSWITEGEDTTRSGRRQGIEFVVPAWLYQGILDRLLVLLSRDGKRRSGTAHRQERDP